MMHSMMNGRNPRTKNQIYNPMHNPFANYCTETLQKSEMKFDFENHIFLNKLHLIPDPLMKNLADTIITAENTEKPKKQSLETPKMPSKPPSVDEVRVESTLAGITNFFSGVFNMLSGAVFRTKSPVDYDCFDATARQGSSQSWHQANDQDKNGLNELSDVSELNGDLDMNNCDTVISCEEKLTQVKCLLSKPTNKTYSWRKRPKKVFVEPGTVEDSVEDVFANEDFVSLSNDTHMEFHSPPQYQTQELCETEAPKTKIENGSIKESTEIVMEVSASDINNTQMKSSDLKAEKDNNNDNMESKNTEESVDDKQQLVSSCEDKLSKLKALLQEKRTKNTKVMNLKENTEPMPAKTIPITKTSDKQFKDPHIILDKNHKMKPSIQDDVIFANDIDIDSNMDSSTPSTINSSVTSLGDHFDEMKGRFRSTSATESEDSFQIVFNDSPKHRRDSDCDSEDSFIVFEDHDCYTSTDVFRESDSESDVSDSGCGTMTCKLSHSMSRTVSNLTDDTLYESCDEVDCAKVDAIGAKSLLMDANKRSQRKDQPAKKVHFSEEPPTVKVMRVWAYAARQARAGHWERYALDRERFKRRIADVDMAVSWVLKPQHRSRVMFQRFMPLWNRQRRQELAEKKEAEVKRKEEERIEQERIDAERMEPEKKDDETIEERNEGEKIEQETKEDTIEAGVNEEKKEGEKKVKETQKASRSDKEKKGKNNTQKNKSVIICH